MAISVHCPECGRAYNVKDDAAGKRFKCKDCQAFVPVPQAAPRDEWDDEDYGDPYGEAESSFAPAPARSNRSGGRRAGSSAAAGRTLLPAIFMYICCAFSLGYSLLQLIGTLTGFIDEGVDESPAVQLGFYSVLCLFIVRDVFLIYAFSRVQTLQSFGIAFAGAIVSVIPLLGSPCCLLGLPFGIWALVVLNDPSVKAAFR